MSDQENIKPDEESDVEAHRRKQTLMANEGEAQDDTQDDDDVELHGRSKKVL